MQFALTMDTNTKILVCAILAFLSLALAENNEEAVSNRIDEKTETADRNARHIQVAGISPYYPEYTNRYYPSNSYPDRYPISSYYPGGGSTSFDRYNPSKFDPSYWLSKLPNFPSGTYNPQYPNNPGTSGYPSYPSGYPSGYPSTGGTNFIGYYPSSRYPGYSGNPSSGYPSQNGYPTHSGYPSQSGYPGQSGYPSQSGYPGHGGYPGQSGYPSQGGYPTHGNGGYGGYGGNGGYLSYSGYDGYYAAGNRPGNVGYGYHLSRTDGNIIPGNRSPATFPSIVTPSTVSKDA